MNYRIFLYRYIFLADIVANERVDAAAARKVLVAVSSKRISATRSTREKAASLFTKAFTSSRTSR